MSFLKLAVVFFICTLVAGAADRPNVVFMIVDDSEELDYACLGGDVLTPNIDRLAREGVRFRNGFTTSSVCTPTRYCCLTGQYASRAASLRTFDDQPPELPAFVRWNTKLEPGGHNVASVLSANGYTSAMIGKWHIGSTEECRRKIKALPSVKAGRSGGKEVDEIWALDDPAVNKYLRDRYEITVEDIRQNYGFDYVASFYGGNLTDYPKKKRKFKYHNQDWITKGALDFLDNQAGSEKPFFMYFSTTLQHGPAPRSSIRADRRITAKGLIKDAPACNRMPTPSTAAFAMPVCPKIKLLSSGSMMPSER